MIHFQNDDMPDITIKKLHPTGQELIRYQGKKQTHSSTGIVILAAWTLPAKHLGYALFEPGDHFIEYYYTNHWFNIFEVSNKHGCLKGWYCNIAEPAQITEQEITQVDLFLDVWVYPDKTFLILDEDEFAAATQLTSEQRQGAREGLQEIIARIQQRKKPFFDTTY